MAIPDTPRSQAFRRQRRRLLAASDICHICGEPGADAIDHVIPRSRGGPDEPWNLRPAHHNVPNSRGVKCNRVKGDKTPDLRMTTTREW